MQRPGRIESGADRPGGPGDPGGPVLGRDHPTRRARGVGGILAGPVDGPARVRAVYPDVEGAPGLRVEHRGSRFGGSIVGWEAGSVLVLGRSGQQRAFVPSAGGFHVDGRAVNLVKPRRPAPEAAGSTASGSLAPPDRVARVARSSRILVEGVHDAELVEKVWGDDLRAEGVVVLRLDGADHLAQEVRSFRPGPGRRLGVLLDHLVPGTKESRLAADAAHAHLLVTGHPFVDIWQAVRPARLGIERWPEVGPGRPWKEGVCDALGVGEPGPFWRRLLATVQTYADLEPELVGAVERLIDFVTEPEG